MKYAKKLLTIASVVIVSVGSMIILPTSKVYAATCTWTGASANNTVLGEALWSDSANWSGCSGAGGIPGSGDDLIFPAGMPWTTNTDDLNGLSIASITFTSNTSYTLSGVEAISITAGIFAQDGNHNVFLGGINVAQSNMQFYASATATLNIAGTTNLGSLPVDVSATSGAGQGVRFYSSILGAAGSAINKYGDGDLYLGIGDVNAQNFNIYVINGSVSTDTITSTYLPYYKIIDLAAGTHLYLNSSGGTGGIIGSGTIHTSRSFHQIRYQGASTFTGDIVCDINGACGASDQISYLSDGISSYVLNRSGGSISYGGEIMVNAGASLYIYDTDLSASNNVAVVIGNLYIDGTTIPTLNVGSLANAGQAYAFGPNTIGSLTTLGSSTLGSRINASSGYGEFDVLTTASISAATSFSVFGFQSPNLGEIYTMINNVNGGAPVTNAFAGLPQGGTLTLNAIPLQADYTANSNTEFRLIAQSGGGGGSNTAPDIADLGHVGSTSQEGIPYDFFVDFSDDDASDVLTVTIDWGDGVVDTILSADFIFTGTTSLSGADIWEVLASHTYADNASYTINVTVNDDNGGSDSASLPILIDNVEVVLNNSNLPTSGNAQAGVNQSFNLSFDIVDPSPLDEFAVFIDWGDGNNEVFVYPAGSTSVSQSHTYMTAGIYTITVSALDDDSGMDDLFTLAGSVEVSTGGSLSQTGGTGLVTNSFGIIGVVTSLILMAIALKKKVNLLG